MKAVICTKYGAPEVLQIKEKDKPQPRENEVLIKIHASSIAHVDCAFRKGEPFISRLFTGISKPKHEVPGDILSGEIESVGKDVRLFKKGDKVFGHAGVTFGAHGEYICLSEKEALIKKPDNMSHAEAAAISYSAMTALPFLKDYSSIKKGDKVLVNGASGAIGTFAVQIANYFGAEVTGVCGSSNIEMVKSQGAKYAIDYTKEDFTNSSSKFDVVFDAVGKSSYSKCKKVLKEDGIYLTTVPTFDVMVKTLFGSKKAKFVATGLRKVPEKIKDLEYLKEMFDGGHIKPVIDKCYSLEQIVDAHLYVDKGHNKGNVVLKIYGGKI